MKLPPIPADERGRLATLQRAGILDTPREPAFDDLVAQAARICGTPISLISFVAEHHLWIKAGVGLGIQEIPRDIAICAHTVAEELSLEVEDMLQDPRFFDCPMTTSAPFIRFYAGVPIKSGEHAIGTLCVADRVARGLTTDQRELLRALARQAATLVELRCMAATVTARAEEALAAKARLERERALLSGVLRSATEYAIIGCDPSGKINVFNQGAERMLGYRAEELLGSTPVVLHDEGELAARAAELGIEPGIEVFRLTALQREAATREWTYVRKDGARVPVSITMTAVHDDAGQLTGFVGFARDLTGERIAERRRADVLVERAGRAAAERALAWLGHLHAFTLSLSAASTCQQVIDVILCQAMASLDGVAGSVGVLRDDGDTLDVVRARRQPPFQEQTLSLSITSPTPVCDAVRTRTAVFMPELDPGGRYGHLLGSPWLSGCKSVAAAPLLVEGHTHPLGAYSLGFAESRGFREEDRIFLLALGQVCAQALERVQLFEAQARARGEAETANRNKDEFLSSLSHELRTPLTAVLGWAHMLQTPGSAPDRLRHGLAVIERNAASQLRLIEDLLDISRIIAGKLELEPAPVDLAAVVRAAVEAARPLAEAAGVRFVVALDAEIGPVLGDADRLQQVVSNLLSNAVKFTPRGGRIEARLDRIEGRARVRVSDTGEGIEPDFLPHIFERFRQADSTRTRTHGGLGLGLAIVRHLVELHRGTITAESDGVGCGATFTVALPLQCEA